MDVSQIAKRFPLVARPRPACPPLAERVREITDLAAAAKRDNDVPSATVALNKAALTASDCGMPDLARALCWRHAETVLRAQPLGAQEARHALEPLVNLARLRIRELATAGRRRLAARARRNRPHRRRRPSRHADAPAGGVYEGQTLHEASRRVLADPSGELQLLRRVTVDQVQTRRRKAISHVMAAAPLTRETATGLIFLSASYTLVRGVRRLGTGLTV